MAATTPPADGGGTPPAGDGDTPPADGGDTPPADDGGTPTDGGGTPPAGDGDMPTDGGDTPPAGDGDTPADGGGAPPAGDGGAPTDGGGSAPVAADTVYIPSVNAAAYDIGWNGLSSEEQLIVELVNRARMDPNGEASLQNEGLASGVSGSPSQPVGVLGSLSAAAEDHSADMEARNYFSHYTPEGDTPTDRAQAAGYSDGGVGENIGWIGSTSTAFDAQDRATAHHENLWASDGHQRNLMDPDWDAIGVGYVYGDYTYQGTNYQGSTFVTENFGQTDVSYLTGVVIDDLDGDDFYDIGEGQGDVMVTAYNDGGVYTTSTYDAGGYTLELAPGTYTVVFHGGDLDGVHEAEVTIGGDNVKLDVIEGQDTEDLDVVTTDTVEEAVAMNDAALTSALAGAETGEDEAPDEIEALSESGAEDDPADVVTGADAPADTETAEVDEDHSGADSGGEQAPEDAFAFGDCDFEFDRDLYSAEIVDEAEMGARFQAMLEELGIAPGQVPVADPEVDGTGLSDILDGVRSFFAEQAEGPSIFDREDPYEAEDQPTDDLLV